MFYVLTKTIFLSGTILFFFSGFVFSTPECCKCLAGRRAEEGDWCCCVHRMQLKDSAGSDFSVLIDRQNFRYILIKLH